MDMTAGVPNPPFLMIAPRGAPIKKKTRQAKDIVSFLFHSTSYFLIVLISKCCDSFFSIRILFPSFRLEIALARTVLFSNTGRESNRSEERRVGKECRSRW